MKNPYLKKKNNRKYSSPFSKQIDSITPKKKNLTKSTKKTPQKQSLRDNTLMTLNSTEKNPIIFPSALKKFVHKKKILLSPIELSKLSIKMNKNVTSFDDRLNTKFNFDGTAKELNSSHSLQGILRWDNKSFMNKDITSKAELKNIKKVLKDKKLLKNIESYRKSQIKTVSSICSIDEKKDNASDDTSDSQRKDVFGNNIVKGGNTHRVCFSFHGDLKIVENWKKLNKKNSIKPDKSLAFEKDYDKKKKCSIF